MNLVDRMREKRKERVLGEVEGEYVLCAGSHYLGIQSAMRIENVYQCHAVFVLCTRLHISNAMRSIAGQWRKSLMLRSRHRPCRD